MITCYIDKQGYPRAVTSDEGLSSIAAYFEQDIQFSLHSVALIEDAISKIEKGTLNKWEGTGNAFTLQITPELVLVQNEFENDLSSTLSLEDFRKALESWQCLLQISSSGSRLP